ncbi:hypothetical protein AB4K05_03520 [Kluyvera sp. STS39-E]|uniref:hypothetical protein n=1 Tax=Kluyvera sp. STS39-E TaxID=3234748 RepID=UPI0034C63D16
MEKIWQSGQTAAEQKCVENAFFLGLYSLVGISGVTFSLRFIGDLFAIKWLV